MSFKWKRKVITLKTEVTYGTDAVPTGGANAMLMRNVNLSPLILDSDDRDYEVSYFGNKGKIIAGQHVTLQGDIEFSGSGAAGTAPAWGPAAKACAMSETVNAGVSVVYAPISTGEGSCDIYFYLDGRLHKIKGARGSMKAMLESGKAPLLTFMFTGLYTGPTDTALASPTLSGFIAPVAVNFANTQSAALHTFAGKFRSITFDQGNVMDYRNLVGSEVVAFTDRKSVGQVKLEDELVATKDWWTIMKAGTTGALSIPHGTVAGNIVTLAAPNVQLSNPQMSSDNGIALLGMDMDLVPSSAGNDEFSITCT